MAGTPPTRLPAAVATSWEVVITEWALDAYLNLKHAGTFSDAEYWSVIRPDVELLRTGAPGTDPKFQSSTFWGPAKLANVPLRDGYKMKWHQVGPGRVQLRLRCWRAATVAVRPRSSARPT